MLEHWAAAFREFIPEIKTERWYPLYLKSGEVTRTEQIRRTLLRIGIEDDTLAASISKRYMELRDQHLTLFPDAKEVLDALKPKYPLGLITNGPADIQRMEVAKLGIESYFDNIFIEGEMLVGKPAPEVFARAARAVNLPPENIMFVGNSYDHDVRPAIAAGWTAVWIRRPSDVPPSTRSNWSRQEPNLLEELPPNSPHPHFTITELSELLPILGF
jgi:putative hydrolase of the HAD superfamily